MLSGLCQSLLVKYGLSEANTMGSAFHGFLTTASACLLTTALLISCYVLSPNSQQLIRQSIFVSYVIMKYNKILFFCIFTDLPTSRYEAEDKSYSFSQLYF